MSRGPRTLGSVYKEQSAERRTAWRAERWVTLPDGTKRRVVARGNTEAEAIRKRTQKEHALARAHPDAERLTVEAFLARWLESKRNLKPNTEREYARIVKHTVAVIGGVPLAKVTPLHVQRVLDAHSPATANAIRRYLKGAFRQAERWELIQLNPVRNIEPVKRPPIKRGVWQPPEIKAFLDAATPTYRALFTAAVFTGLRRGELLALPWANVTPTSVTVDRTWTRGGVVGTPKTAASNRTVPIHPNLYRVLIEGRGHAPGSPWAFPSGTGTMLGSGNLGRAYREALTKSGVPRIRMHDLRRIAATLWARQGHSPTVIQRLLGHSTPHLALAVYTDVMRDQLLSAALDPALIEEPIAGGIIGGLENAPSGRTGERVGEVGVDGAPPAPPN
jgi:integrase